ncbi:MAG: polyphosphate glucokinase [Actinomycetia bacterium]|nr:polyphosphate glucokinase [Actinomycetes bacterium]
MTTIRMGIDIGGTGIKGAPVDLETGTLTAGRLRVLTPEPATPDAVADVVAQIVDHFQWTGPIGCTFPAVVRHGVTLTAANVDQGWVGCDAAELLSKRTGQPVTVLNDADAAGVAEMRFGVGRGRKGTIIMVTLGTGIGTALFTDGILVPNTELGHLEIHGVDAETRASDAARTREDLTWKHYAKRVDEYLDTLVRLFTPDLIVIGGGASKNADKFLPRLTCSVDVVPAQLLNEAGIIGAALSADPPETVGGQTDRDPPAAAPATC